MNEAVAPAGKSAALKVMTWEDPDESVVLIVLAPELPRITEMLPPPVSVKSKDVGVFTVSVNVSE